MKRIVAIAASAAALGGLTMMLSQNAEAQRRPGKCVLMTAKGTGLGQAMAKSFTADALADNAAQKGLRTQGAIKYKCVDEGLTTCTGSQRACPAPAAKKKS